MKKYVLILLGLSLPVLTKGNGGIELSLLSHRQASMGFAGVAIAYKASIMYHNPGALSFVYKNHIQFGSGVILPFTQFRAETPSLYIEDLTQNSFYSPLYAYGSWRTKNPNFTFGVALTNPFGYLTSWPEDWKGRFIVQESSIRVYHLQPTISYRINEQWGIGLGVTGSLGSYLLRRALPVSGIDETEGNSELSGRGFNAGVNVGVYYRPSTSVSFGISYKSGMKLKIKDGSASFQVPASLEEAYPTTAFETSLHLPQNITAGFAYYRPTFTLAMDISLSDWRRFKTQEILYATETSLIENEVFNRRFTTSFAFRMGGEYTFTEKVAVRAGWYYNSSPVPDGFLSPEFPDADVVGLTGGVKVPLAGNLSMDLSYVYEFSGERTGILQEASFGGTYISARSSFGIGINYTL
ncbi:MAG: outer membrane protein transport protein [Bacteroidota bacterium]